MTRKPLLREEDFESKILREAAESLNFIWLLASTYRAPELLEFLGRLRRELCPRTTERCFERPN